MAESDLHSTWIRLRTGKEFSRMLYPNPVCFLSTWKVSASSPATASSSAHHDNAVVTAVGSDNTRSGEYSQLQHAGNAMVLSWLTPTNNSGRFMFSINKSRYSASLLAPSITDITTSAQRYRAGVEFTLSVPTRGMEQKIIDTGSISGRFGSKFALERGAESQNHSANNELQNISPWCCWAHTHFVLFCFRSIVSRDTSIFHRRDGSTFEMSNVWNYRVANV